MSPSADVVTGDPRKWPPLPTASKGADVLIHEAQNADMTRQMVQGLKALGNPRMASIMNDTLSYHTTPVEAADIARAAGVRQLVLYHLTQAVYWDMGFNLLLLMFAGVILGGLGSAYGAMVGSFVVGLVAQLSTLWFPVELQNAWALLALIVVLLLRPQGILGRAERAG